MHGARWTTTGMTAAVLVALALFFAGCEGEHHDGPHHEGDDHMMEDGEHHRENGGSNGGDLSLSGKIEGGERVVEVTARQFEFEPAKIVVRQGEKVQLRVTSEDVKHGIAVEAFGIDQELPPQETQAIEFTADKVGRHHFHCSVYCGVGHDQMHGELVVVEAGNE